LTQKVTNDAWPKGWVNGCGAQQNCHTGVVVTGETKKAGEPTHKLLWRLAIKVNGIGAGASRAPQEFNSLRLQGGQGILREKDRAVIRGNKAQREGRLVNVLGLLGRRRVRFQGELWGWCTRCKKKYSNRQGDALCFGP
jgi:hypothetical protein